MTTPTERRLAITPGEWSWRNADDLRTLHDKGSYQYGAQVLGIGSDIDGAPELVISEPDRELIADAGTTANACDMLPSEILARLREAQDVVVHMVSAAKYHFKHGNDTNLDKQTDIADAFLSNLNLPK